MSKRFEMEALEPRILLSADGLNPVLAGSNDAGGSTVAVLEDGPLASTPDALSYGGSSFAVDLFGNLPDEHLTPGAAPSPSESNAYPEGKSTGSQAADDWNTQLHPQGLHAADVSVAHIPQTTTIVTDEAWSGTEKFIFDLSNADGIEGTSNGWDLIRVSGVLTIGATADNPFTIEINSVTPAGNPLDAVFDKTRSYSWRIVHTTGGITGFDRSKFVLDKTKFTNSVGVNSAFAVDISSNGQDLFLRYMPDLPSVVITDNPINWQEQGPSVINGNANTILPPDNSLIGGVQAVAVHPTDPAIAFLGAVDGGVWKSTNFNSPTPTWTSISGTLPSLAIGSLAVSRFDADDVLVTNATPANKLVLFAGTGSFSSSGAGGTAEGMFRSVDGGAHWKEVGNFDGLRISAIVTSSTNSDVVFAGTLDFQATTADVPGKGGVYRSIDGGDHWDRLSGKGGLPEFTVTDLAQEPGNADLFYVALAGGAPAAPGVKGVWRTPLGSNANVNLVTWNQVVTGIVPNNDHDATPGEAGETLDAAIRIRLSVSATGTRPVYAAVLSPNPSASNQVELAGVFRSPTQGNAWQRVGTEPATNSTGQGDLHFTIVADPSDEQRVFIAGAVNGTSPFLGIAFRWDNGTSTWTQITTTTGAGPGSFNTAPHGDFRKFVFSSDNNDLILAGDGGIYRLKSPRIVSPPAWEFIGRDLKITEIGFSVAYDHNTNSIFAGTQDAGVIRQTGVNGVWSNLTGGDGNYVAVSYNGGTSTRYYMSNGLLFFFRRDFTGPDAFGAETRIFLRSSPGAGFVSGLDNTTQLGGLATDQTFDGFQPVPTAVNAVEPNWLLLGRIMLYASTDRGDTISTVSSSGPSDFVTAVVYGGFDNGVGNSGVMYVARGSTISVSSDNGTSFHTVTPVGGGSISNIILDPKNWRRAFAVDATHVWLLEVNKDDGTVSARDVTGNLDEITGGFQSVEMLRRDNAAVVLVGARDGIYRLGIDDVLTFGNNDPIDAKWTRLDQLFPNAVVSDLTYDETDNVLVAGTMGRGAWLMPNASNVLFQDPVLRIDTGSGDDHVTIRLAPDDGGAARIEVLIEGISAGSFQLSTIKGVEVHTGAGSDFLTIDSSNGEVVVPGGIKFDGGEDAAPDTSSDTLGFEGTKTSDLETDTDGDVEIRQLGQQIVRASNVENFQQTTVGEDIVNFFKHLWDDISDFFSSIGNLLTGDTPVVGTGLGSGLNGGNQGKGQAKGDPDAEEEGGPEAIGENPDEGISDVGSLWNRLFSSGFRPEDLGSLITTAGGLQSILDGLDGFAGNVTVTDGVTKAIQLGIADPSKPFRRTVTFDAPINVELFGGLIKIHGELEFAVDIDLRLEVGVDSHGFYIATNATALPEVTVRNLRINGKLEATGNFGLIAIALEDASIEMDEDVAIQINIIEKPDPYGHPNDGKLRLYELTRNPLQFFSVNFVTAPGDDLILETDIRVQGLDPDDPDPLFDLPIATVQIIWPDITNPLKVTVKPVGGPAEFLYRLLNFKIEDLYSELKRTLSGLDGLSTSALLDVELPFGSGLSIGGSLDFSTAFLDKIFAKLVDIELTSSSGNGKPTGKFALGQLTGDAVFFLSVDEATAKKITVTKSSTDTGADTNSSLSDLVKDINEAITAAGLGTKVLAFMKGRQIALRLTQGASLKITGEASNPAFTEIGFNLDDEGIALPKLPTMQQVIEEIEQTLAPFDINPHVDLANKVFSIDVSFGYHLLKTTSFKFDPNIGMGDLAEVSASGTFSISGDPHVSFTLGVDLSDATAPKMTTSATLPPPSSGSTTAGSTFTINLNDGEYRVNLFLPGGARGSLQQLANDLNALLVAAPAFRGSPLRQVLRFSAMTYSPGLMLEAVNEDADGDGAFDTVNEDANGNHVLDTGEDLNNDGHLDVNEDQVIDDPLFKNNTKLDSWLGKVTSIGIEAANTDPIVTELGFNNVVPSRSGSRGVFLENVDLGGTLTVSASDLKAKARFAIFEISTTGGTAVGTLTGSLKLKNPHPTDLAHPTRLDLDVLLKHMEDLSTYITPDTSITGSVDIKLKNISISPNLPTTSGNPLLPAGSELRVYIPDIKDVHYNSVAYDPVTNNKGLFITYPAVSSFGDFSCASFLDVIGMLDTVSDQLEQLKAFSFLNQPLPLVNVSIGDVLDFAGDLAKLFKQLSAGDTEAITKLESDIEKALGLNPANFAIILDDARVSAPAGGTVSTKTISRFNPSGLNNALIFTAKNNGAAFNDWKIDITDDASLTSGADLAAVAVDSTNKILKIRYNATFTRAITIRNQVNATAASPFAAALDLSASPNGDGPANDGTNAVTQTALKFHLQFGLSYGNTLPLNFSLGDIVNLLPPGHPARALLDGVSDIFQIEGSTKLNVTASAVLNLDFGLDVSGGCNLIPFIYDTSGLTLSAAVRATNLNLTVGIGGLKVGIKNGSVTIDADGNAATTDSATFAVTFKDNNGDGRHYFRSSETFFDSNNIGVTLTGAASANLPLFALDSIPIGSTSDGPDAGTEPDNWLVFQSGPLDKLLTGDMSQVVVRTPDISNLFSNVNACDLITHPEVLVDGLDAFLGTVEDALGSKLARGLPLVGDGFGKAADAIMEFRTGLLAKIRQTLAEGGDPITLAKKAIFEALGSPGLNILAKADGSAITSADQVDIKCENNAVKFNIRLKKSVALLDTSSDPINFDIGIPGLGLSVDGNVKISIGFDFKLKFVVSATEGFYFDTSDPEELRVDFSVTIPGLKAKGQLLFLQLDVADESDGKSLVGQPRESSHFTGFFSVNLKDPIGSGNKLTIGDLTSGGLNFDKLVEAKLGAQAVLALDISLSFGGDARFPRIVAEFDLKWDWTLGGDGAGTLEFGFHNVSLDVGSFIADFMAPIFKELKKITEPLQPVVDVITAPIPIISDLAGRPYSLLDLAETFGLISSSTRQFIDTLVVVIRLANSTALSDGSLLLPLGSFDMQMDKFGKVSNKPIGAGGPVDISDVTKFISAPAWVSGAKVSPLNAGHTVGAAGVSDAISGFLEDLEKIGITLPFLSLSEISKIFVGKPISLFEYHLPTLDFKAGFELSVPIIGPLFVKFGGKIGAYADLTIGYDTYGIQKFFSSKEKNVLDIFDGFYIKDVDKDGVDVPELVLTGALYAAGSIDIVIAEAGVRGGLEVEIDFNLNDPDDDGRVRISEIVANAQKDIRCIFDIHGEFTAFLEAYLIINLFILKIDATFRFAEITLLEFDITCPEPRLADYVDAGGSELEEADGAGSLRLNIGKYAGEREVGDTTDGNEHYTVTHIEDGPGGETVEVSFGGIKQTYHGVKKIWGIGGAGKDIIDLRTVSSPIDSGANRGLHGSDGDDTIYAGRGGGRYDGDNGNDIITAEENTDGYTGRNDEFHGGTGKDVLTGLEGDDQLFGEEGDDTILGGLGNDHLFGGSGNDKIVGDEGDDEIEGNEGADDIAGNEGEDKIKGGAGDDLITGDNGIDFIVGNAGDDNIDGGLGNDVLLGDEGVIVNALQVTGIDGTGNDLLAGGPGTDIIFGAGGRDALYGGTLLVTGTAKPGDTATDTEDFIDGGDQDDIIYADDAHSAALTSFPGANIGDMVWFDSLDEHGVRNNTFDLNEKGVAGIKVELLDAASTVLAKTTTDAKGNYKFTGLKAGDYKVRFTLPTGLAFIDKDQGSDDLVDSDVNVATGVTDIFHVNSAQIDYSRDAGVKGTKPVLVIDNPSIEEGNTGISYITFTVTMSSISDQFVAVCYETKTGTALNIVDYTSVDYTLVFAPGETVKTIKIAIIGDVIDEVDESFTVELCDPWVAEVDAAHSVGTATIIDDDAAPVVRVEDGVQNTALIPVPENTPMTFTVTLSNPSYQPITVKYLTQQVVDATGRRVVDGARAGVDYSGLNETIQGTLVFLPGQVSKTVVVSVFGDALSEYNEQFQLRVMLDAATPSDAASVGREVGTGRIADDDPLPYVEFSPIVTVSVSEGHAGNTIVPLTVHLTAVAGRDVTFNWNTTAGTASNAAGPGELPDYAYKFDTVTFREGETSKTIEVEVVGDTRLESDEYFFVNLLTAVNGRLNVVAADLNHAVITIKNDESGDPGPWYVEFARPHYEVKESEGKIIVPLVRAEGSSEPVAVYWSIGGTATPGVDYSGIWENGTSGPRGITHFEAGETTKYITIPISIDGTYEGNETIVLNLLNPTGGPVRGINDATLITIIDTDPLPTIQIFAVNLIGPDIPDGVAEGDPIQMLFDVIATGKSDVDVKVDWVALNGTAIAPLDFVPNGGTLNFGHLTGTSKTITVKVTIIDDAISEDPETVIGQLSNAVNGEITGYQDSSYIYDNDFSAITGFVFNDANRNGFYDSDTESGLAGVTVKLKDYKTEYVTATGPDGKFHQNVLLGSLTVTVDETTTPEDSSLTTGNNPLILKVNAAATTLKDVGYALAPKKAKPDTSIGNGLAFFNDTVYGGPGSDIIDGGPGNDWLVGGHWLGPGCACAGLPYSATLKQFAFADGNRVYVDPASIPAPGTITGVVWIDNNLANNRRDGLEAGLKNVQVNLFDEDWVLVGITYTDALGQYKFEKLAACDYYVQFMVPAGYTIATKDVGSDNLDSDADTTTGLTTVFHVNAGQTVGNNDIGLHPVPAGSNGPWSLQFSQLVYSVRETDGSATITITRTPNSLQPVGTWWTESVTATHGSDYIGIWENGAAGAPGRRTISFGVDENSKSFVISIKNDAATETPPEYFKLFLKNPTGGPVYGNLPEAIVLIFDNPCPDNDTIYAQDGDDVVMGDFGYFSNAGVPQLLGGIGDDTIYGSTGNDKIYGEGGNDRIEGAAGNDMLDGGGENDTYLFDGDKTIGTDSIVEVASPFGGNDTIDLSQTSSKKITLDLSSAILQVVTDSFSLTLPAGNVIENITGGDQDDILTGNDLNNLIIGGLGKDTLEGKAGDDDLRGGLGSDTYIFDADLPLGHDNLVENNLIAAFKDQDLIDFSSTTVQSVKIDLGSSISQTVNPTFSITLSSDMGIENVYGGTQNDTLIGNKRNNRIKGGAGNDNIDGGPPGDTSSDTLVEERGGGFNLTDTTVTLISTGEVDTYADFENVSLSGDDNDNMLDAHSFSGEVHLDGRGGNDTLIGGTGKNFLSGGSGNDSITGNGVDTITEERDADFTLTNTQLKVGPTEVDNYIGTIERVELTGGAGGNWLDASAFTTGTVKLDGGAGNDTLIGTKGADLLIGGAGDDSLEGLDGNDTYQFDADTAQSDASGDVLTETSTGGEDTIDFSPTQSLGVSISLALGTLQIVNGNLQLRLSSVNVFENLIGGDSNDVLVGNTLVNKIEGRSGNDTLSGGTGDDTLDGGTGVDGFGKPFIDRIVEERNLSMSLSDAALLVAGGESDTLISIEAATLIGGVSNNILSAIGFTGSATLDGRGANDILFGGSGDDFLIGGAGNDSMAGGPGDDTYVFDADTDIGNDAILELVGGGTDTLDYSSTSTAQVTVSLGLVVAQIAARTPAPGLVTRHTLTLSAADVIENLTGGSLRDTIVGNALPNRLFGNGDNDILMGLAGDDWMQGGDGDDTYFFDADGPIGFDHIWEDVGSGGNDTLNFQLTGTPVHVDLGEGEMQVINANLSLRLIVCHGVENVIGSTGSDTLIGNGLDNRFAGMGGNDTMTGERGSDTYVFDSDLALGSDNIVEAPDIEGGIDTIDLSATTGPATNFDLSVSIPQVVNGNLTLDLNSGASVENLKGGDNGGTVSGNSLNNIIEGGLGNDVISGKTGNDILIGHGGNDTLSGQEGDDTYVFNADQDSGVAVIIEAAVGGTDTIDFSPTLTTSVGVNLANPGLQVVAPGLSLFLGASDRIENLTGGSGADVLQGNSLDNVLAGGPGNDRYVFDADLLLGSDIILEATGIAGGFDSLDFSLTTGFGISVNLSVTTRQIVAIDNSAVPDPLKHLALDLRNPNSIEAVLGGAKDDFITGDDSNNAFTGGLGNDTIIGGLGNDLLFESRDANFKLSNTSLTIGLFETDTIDGIDGAFLTGGASANVIDAAAFTFGPVTLDGGLGNDTLRGSTSSEDRIIVVRDANMQLFDNKILIGAEIDILSSIENATLIGGASANGIDASNFLGAVIIAGGDGNDTLIGGEGDDIFIGDAGNDVFDGGLDGTDKVVEMRDANFVLTNSNLQIAGETDGLISIEMAELTGGAGDNIIDASAFSLGPLTLHGAGGNDILKGGARNDTLEGGSGNDALAGGAGGDTYLFDSVWGNDNVQETPGASAQIDVLQFGSSVITVNLQPLTNPKITADGLLSSVNFADDSIEKIIGSTESDTFNVSPSAVLAIEILGGGGAENVINYDSQGLPAAQTTNSISTGGYQTISFSGIEIINALHTSPIIIPFFLNPAQTTSPLFEVFSPSTSA